MALTNSNLSSVLSGQFSKQSMPSPRFGIVYSVILDENHPLIKQRNYETIDSRFVGCIQFRYQNDLTQNEKDLPIAYPADKNFINIPIRNEIVEIVQSSAGPVLYRRIGAEPTPNFNASPGVLGKAFESDGSQNYQQNASNYKKVSQTGISKTNNSDSLKYDGYGDYFQPQKIHKLKLFEGDTLIQSRFGQSIRFSAYNNGTGKNRTFSPTIIIRNSQSDVSRKTSIENPIEEDINRDGTSIVLGSNQYQLPFQPGVVSDKGSSDFETKPNSFKGYPSKLIGDQLLLNSGRIILSAKNAEMIFYSKKNYGFISDGALSIDNKLGINANVNDNVVINTNNRDVRLITGTGRIFLGKFGQVGNAGSDIQKMVMGGELIKTLRDLIDAITKQQYATPCGPTAAGPTNIAEFNLIKAKLNQILSNNNYLSR